MAGKVIKICWLPWETESRDKRELSACRELGLEPLVINAGEDGDWFREDNVDGFPVYRFSTKPLGKIAGYRINREASVFTWAWAVRKLKPVAISGHNIRSLFIGWVSTWGLPLQKRPALIYDSHEFELGRNVKRGKVQVFFVKYLERFLMKRCAFSIMVNDSIADEVQRIHGLKDRPVVVRSTPNQWMVDREECRRIREKLVSAIKSPREMLLMYHGAVSHGRGVEMLLKLTQKNPNVCLVVLGYGESTYFDELKEQARKLDVSDRVVFHPAVAIEELWKYVGAADVGMITVPAVVRSYYFMLPNKFFENIQSETPVICSDYPAIAPIVKQYGIGLTCDPEDLDAINVCVEKMRLDKDLYTACKNNTKKAKEDLCWEKEKNVLLDAYRKALGM